MPQIHVLNDDTSDDTQITVTPDLAPNAYHCQEITFDEPSKSPSHAIHVPVRKVRTLKADDTRILYTDALATCFPVIFLFNNGDVALFHGATLNTDRIEALLNKPSLQEIHIFAKSTNADKVRAFRTALYAYIHTYRTTENDDYPSIKFHNLEQGFSYNMAACFRNSNNELVTMIGCETPIENARLSSEEGISECPLQTYGPSEYAASLEWLRQERGMTRRDLLPFQNKHKERQSSALELFPKKERKERQLSPLEEFKRECHEQIESAETSEALKKISAHLIDLSRDFEPKPRQNRLSAFFAKKKTELESYITKLAKTKQDKLDFPMLYPTR